MYRELVGVLPLVVQLLVDPKDSSVLVNGEIASLVTRYDGVADFAILTLFIWMVRHGHSLASFPLETWGYNKPWEVP